MSEQRGEPNYIKEAFQWQYNVIGLGAAAAASLISLNPLPLILAAGVELMYLASVPQLPAFQRLIRSRKFQAEQKVHDATLNQMLYALPPERRDRHHQLQQVCVAIRANLARLSSASQMFTGQLDARLNGLLGAYVRLANHDMQHVQYLQTTNPDVIRREAASLKDRLPKDSPRVREINIKRVEILQKRLEKYDKIRENRQVIDAQCRAIEDVLQLIREQSLTMSDPQQVSDRLELLVKDVESTEDAVREVETIFQMSPELESMDETAASERNRLMN